jgi:hypothetical protein
MTQYNAALQKLLTMPVRVFISASGAGAGIQQILWEPPGASSYLAGAAFPYSTEMTEDLLGFRPPKFVCMEEAIDTACSAYLKADNGDPTKQFVGLGLTASVASNTEHRGDHRVHAVVVTKDRVLAANVIVPKGGPTFRQSDGVLADRVGVKLLLVAIGLTEIGDFPIEDISGLARSHFFKRPLFTRYGRRFETPAGNLTLFPGAFNPPHDGHFGNAGEDVTFQITANPPHKPALTLTDMLGRIRHFRGKRDLLFTEDGALYIEKARRFPNSTFVLGTDALDRMLDPKWGIEVKPLLAEFASLGTKFLVTECHRSDGRNFSEIPIPAEFKRMFTQLPPTPYADLSSTQKRAEAAT